MGSKIGLIVGACIVVLVGGAIAFFIFQPAEHSRPNLTREPATLEIRQVSVPVTLVLPAEPTGDGNAASDYQTAIDLVMANKPLFTQAMRGKAPGGQEEWSIIEKVEDAAARGASKKSMDFEAFRKSKPQVAYWQSYSNDLQDLCFALNAAGAYRLKLARQAQDAERQKQLARSLQDYRTYFTVAYHMVKEQAYGDVVLAGLQMQVGVLNFEHQEDEGEPPQGLKGVYAEMKFPLEDLRKYRNDLKPVYDFYAWKVGILCQRPEPHAGDMLNIAANEKDPAIRNMAILMLGVLRWVNVPKLDGDYDYMDKLLDRYSNGSPRERAAAAAARAFTKQNLQDIAKRNEKQPF